MLNNSLEKRIGRLESQVRFWRLIVVALAVLSLASLAERLSAKTERIDATAVVAQEFDLINAKGRITARLTDDPANPDAPLLAFKYPNDKPALTVGLFGEQGPAVSVFNKDGAERASLGQGPQGPSLYLFDNDGHVRIIADIDKEGPQIMILNKAMNKKVWVAPHE